MRGIKSIYSILPVALIAAACSTPKPGTPEFVVKQEDEQRKAAVKSVETSISKAPEWFLKPPQDANSIYTTAEAIHPRMQGAVEMAVGLARKELALRLGGEVSARINQMAESTGTAKDVEYVEALDLVTKTVTIDTNVAGYVLEKKEFLPEGGNYKVFVLLRFPIGEANKVAADQVKKSKVLDSRFKATKAFQDLEREIENHRKR